MHHDKIIMKTKEKPEMIQFYNEMKYMLDIMDKLPRRYTIHRRTITWPLTLFFTIVTIAVLVF